MSLTLLRHAAISQELQHRFIGHSDIELDKNLFDIQKADVILGKKFDFIYSSPLKRCTQTLDLMYVKYFADDRLKEVKFKDFVELKSFDEISQHKDFKDSLLDSYDTWFKFICDESMQIFTNRIIEFFGALPKDKNILVCAHKGVIDMFCKIKDIKIENIDYLDFIEVKNWDI